MISENSGKVGQAVRGFASVKAVELREIQEETLWGWKKVLMIWVESKCRSTFFLASDWALPGQKVSTLKEQAWLYYRVQFVAGSQWLKTVQNLLQLHDVRGSGKIGRAYGKAAEGIWEMVVDALIVRKCNHQRPFLMRVKAVCRTIKWSRHTFLTVVLAITWDMTVFQRADKETLWLATCGSGILMVS